jgi:hypothetical protein
MMTEDRMLFYRSRSGGSNLSLAAARGLSILALAAYPAGALINRFGDGPAPSLIGLGLVGVSLVCTALLMTSSIQRIVGEQVDRLDEYELKLRNGAVSSSYACISGLALLSVIYAAIASDAGWWVPSNYDEYNGLFLGGLSLLLPASVRVPDVEAR